MKIVGLISKVSFPWTTHFNPLLCEGRALVSFVAWILHCTLATVRHVNGPMQKDSASRWVRSQEEPHSEKNKRTSLFSVPHTSSSSIETASIELDVAEDKDFGKEVATISSSPLPISCHQGGRAQKEL